ncbi:hypothetical protein Leryth_006777 [Lithospermum erythrorhizon]|nr:hypothetical protein Leryth_006777 [Lithospermum erythrorhizon]
MESLQFVDWFMCVNCRKNCRNNLGFSGVELDWKLKWQLFGRCLLHYYGLSPPILKPLLELDSWFQSSLKGKQKLSVSSLNAELDSSCIGASGLERGSKFSVLSSLVVTPADNLFMTSEQKVYDVVLKQAALLQRQLGTKVDIEVKQDFVLPGPLGLLDEAYERCREVCAEYAKTFYLGTLLMTPERRKAIWAIYVWCRRTDELVDGPNASHITPTALDRWETRLEDIFIGRPFDMLDAALSDTVSRFPIDIQPFRDMIEGMRMDLWKSRYKTVSSISAHYYVAGTVGLMSVSDGARRGRIYLPQDELAQSGLSEEDIFAGKVTEKWRHFMKKQIIRARKFFDEAENGVTELSSASRWPVWASLLLYRQILDEIEANDYNNFTRRAYVSKSKKILALPAAYFKSVIPPTRLPSPLVKA